jgi:hypothetical protein
MSELKPRVSISHDEWDDNIPAFAFIMWAGGGGGYRYAEIREDVECGLCGSDELVLQMDNGEAGPNSMCKECIAKLFDAAENGTSYSGSDKP